MWTSLNRRGVTRALLGVAAAAVIATAGCGTTPQNPVADTGSASPAESGTSPAPKPSDTRRPVAAAGGLCKLLTYRTVADATGVEFDHAASADGACALQVLGHNHPDLTLAASGTKVDAKKFHETFAPDGADEVDGLGQAAYRVVGDPDGKAGPSAEVGWLAGKKFYVLRYTFEKGATNGQAKQLAPKLVTLAKSLKTG